jgi:hypothetical protein
MPRLSGRSAMQYPGHSPIHSIPRMRSWCDRGLFCRVEPLECLKHVRCDEGDRIFVQAAGCSSDVAVGEVVIDGGCCESSGGARWTAAFVGRFELRLRAIAALKPCQPGWMYPQLAPAGSIVVENCGGHAMSCLTSAGTPMRYRLPKESWPRPSRAHVHTLRRFCAFGAWRRALLTVVCCMQLTLVGVCWRVIMSIWWHRTGGT